MYMFVYTDLIIEFFGRIIQYVGLFIVIGAVIVSLYNVLTPKYTMEQVRHTLARQIIFGLEFVIAADILLATLATDMFQIGRLGGIVLIRVVLGYALRKEAEFK
tara:strand:- start:178 stop:489 length:312 start_codon:yes stop_codon:yes gene_type:complete